MALVPNYGTAIVDADEIKKVGFNDRREVGDIFDFSDASFAEDEMEDTENPANSRKYYVIICKDGYGQDTRISLKQVYRSVRQLRGLKGQDLLNAIKKLKKQKIDRILETERTYNDTNYKERSFLFVEVK